MMLRLLASAVLSTVLLIGCSQQGTAPQASGGPSSVLVLDDSNFDAQIQNGLVLVDFWATWCGPCKTQAPIVETVAQQVKGKATVAKLDVDAAPRAAQRYKIRSIPTLVLFKEGKPVQQFVGVTQAKPLVTAINAALPAQ